MKNTHSSQLASLLTSCVFLLVVGCLTANSIGQTPDATSGSNPGSSATPTVGVVGYWPTANELVQQCQKNWEDIKPLLTEVDEALAAKNVDSIKVNTIGKAYARAQNLVRDGKILIQMGEPAGVDYSFRGKSGTGSFEAVAKQLKSTPAGKKIVGQATKYKAKTDSKRAKRLKKIGDYVSKNDFAKAEKELRGLLSEADTLILWLSPKDGKQLVSQYSAAARLVASSTKKMRGEETNLLILDRIKNTQLAYAALVETAETVVRDIKANGSTKLGGKTAHGPTAFAILGEQWQATHVGLLNCLAHQWSSDSKLAIPFQELFGPNIKATNWIAASTELDSRMQDALTAIIAADAAQAKAEKLPQKYAKYANSIAVLSERVNDKDFLPKFETALEALTKKDTAFASRVNDYHKATNDMLTWRNRVATSQAKNETTYLDPLFLAKDQKCVPQLKAGLHESLPTVRSHVGKTVQVKNVNAINEKALYSCYDQRIYATINSNFYPQTAVDSLVGDLFVGNDQPPLSIAAAHALVTAQNNVFELTGGAIENLHVEAMTSRFGKLTTEMGAFYPLGDLPMDKVKLSDTLLRIDLKPEWVQHKYFFAKMK